jgi:hypothetical protein
MSTWTSNAAMEWSSDNGTTWYKISDHGREALSISVDRIENAQRMADGTMRRYVIAKKRSISTSWTNIPNVATTQLANGQTGSWMENFHDTVDGPFLVRLRAGSDRDTTFTGTQGKILTMLITDFSKEIVKRGFNFDWWNLSVTLTEV